jgi:hypothetical protein
MLESRRETSVAGRLLKHQLKRRSAAQVLCAPDSAAVLLQAFFYIDGDTRVQAPIRATNYVQTVLGFAHVTACELRASRMAGFSGALQPVELAVP